MASRYVPHDGETKVPEENNEEMKVPEENPEDKCIRIVLVGKSGNGKSATANTIIGEKKFKSEASSSSVTTVCWKETVQFDGKKLAVIDTPGFFDSKITDMQLRRETEKQMQGVTQEEMRTEIEDRMQREKEKMKKEIARCISFAAPGPHVFLVVIQATRFTKEDQETVETIQEIFGERAAEYTMALFTRGDDLEADGLSIKDLVEKNEHLDDFVEQCGGGYHVFNNRDKDPSQVRELLKKINTMVQKNGGNFYTTEMFQEAEKAINEVKRILMKQNPDMSDAEAREHAENDNTFITEFKMANAAVLGFGIVVGAAVGGVTPAAALAAAGTAVGTAAKGAANLALSNISKRACLIQ